MKNYEVNIPFKDGIYHTGYATARNEIEAMCIVLNSCGGSKHGKIIVKEVKDEVYSNNGD